MKMEVFTNAPLAVRPQHRKSPPRNARTILKPCLSSATDHLRSAPSAFSSFPSAVFFSLQLSAFSFQPSAFRLSALRLQLISVLRLLQPSAFSFQPSAFSRPSFVLQNPAGLLCPTALSELNHPPSNEPPPERKPWPMSYVAAVTFACLAFYTVFTLAFRKDEPGRLPYEEAQQRAADRRPRDVLGWNKLRLTQTFERQAESPPALPPEVSVSPVPRRLEEALPTELVMVMPGRPRLVSNLAGLQVASAPAADSLVIEYWLEGDLQASRPNVVDGYWKGDELYLFLHRPRMDDRPGQHVRMTLGVEIDLLPPGDYRARLFTDSSEFSWQVTIPPADSAGLASAP
jgi:hypothetical protein